MPERPDFTLQGVHGQTVKLGDYLSPARPMDEQTHPPTKAGLRVGQNRCLKIDHAQNQTHE